MSETNLSDRLLKVASFVPTGARLLDVGSDHAYLPLYLADQGLIEIAIAGEVVAGPYQSANKNVQASAFADKISVRLADGLAAFESADQIDTISICGMGGFLIQAILAAGQEKLSGVKRLILQPNNREDDLRTWLTANDFTIVAEAIVAERGKFYEIIVAEHGQMTLSDLDKRFGPCLRKQQSSVFEQKWRRELDKLSKALEQIPHENEEERWVLKQKISSIKEVIHES